MSEPSEESKTNPGGFDRVTIYGYFGLLTLFAVAANPLGDLLGIPLKEVFRNQLHLSDHQSSLLQFATRVPVYFAFLFGFLRDRWNPLGMRDRGYMLVFASLTGLIFFAMSFAKVEYWSMLLGVFAAMLSYRFVSAAFMGLMSLIGQEQLMSGRLTAVWQLAALFASGCIQLETGWVSEHMSASQIFQLLAVLCVLFGLLGLWKPKPIFEHAYDRPQARGGTVLDDLKRLAKHKPIYPLLLISFLWNYSPGTDTSLQTLISKTLGGGPDAYARFSAINTFSVIPVIAMYGLLSKRVPLQRLMWIAAIVAIPQWAPVIFVHSVNAALIVAAPIGLMGVLANLVYFDLSMRSCPPALQGTLMMLVGSTTLLSVRGSDIIGGYVTDRYPANGFLYCAVSITIVYALILPILLLIPKQIVAAKDGQAFADPVSEVGAESAAFVS
jgi:hypothetical protein